MKANNTDLKINQPEIMELKNVIIKLKNLLDEVNQKNRHS